MRNDETLTASQFVCRRLREIRKGYGMTAEQVGEQCARLGAPQLNRAVLANLETGRREAVSVDELLVPAALECTPVDLLGGSRRWDIDGVAEGATGDEAEIPATLVGGQPVPWPVLRWWMTHDVELPGAENAVADLSRTGEVSALSRELTEHAMEIVRLNHEIRAIHDRRQDSL